MKIGFTGTQFGMTPAQRERLEQTLSECRGAFFHHGDCIGSDAQADAIAHRYGLLVSVHPPKSRTKRAFVGNASKTYDEKDYLTRNKDIVTEADWLIATPREFNEVLRSGTWATIREARRQGKDITIIWPDGRAAVDGKRE